MESSVTATASSTGNLVHLEEYVDTIISLPHEIQRNLTMIREHDSQVQEIEMDLFKDINEFMSLQSKTKEISTSERAELIKRIKNSFLSTLTHCEEKVSLSNQCYNSVEKHLIKMEEDLKCFEEEIRLAGYAELLEKVGIERRRQREQVRNKKRREALLNEDQNDLDGGNSEGNENQENEQGSSSDSSNEQQQQIKKRKPARNTRRQPPASTATSVAAATNNKKQVYSDEDEVVNNKVSRAERLLRRNKPNYVSNEVKQDEVAVASAIEESQKEDAISNQGDDEAEEDLNEESESEVEESESEVDESETDMIEQAPTTPTTPTTNTIPDTLTMSNHSSGSRSSDDTPRRPTNPPQTDTEPLYCTCQRVSFGQMIACDGKECAVEWFHIGCVGLKSLPKGKWYCKECQEIMDAKTAAQLAIGMSTRSSRRSQ